MPRMPDGGPRNETQVHTTAEYDVQISHRGHEELCHPKASSRINGLGAFLRTVKASSEIRSLINGACFQCASSAGWNCPRLTILPYIGYGTSVQNLCIMPLRRVCIDDTVSFPLVSLDVGCCWGFGASRSNLDPKFLYGIFLFSTLRGLSVPWEGWQDFSGSLTIQQQVTYSAKATVLPSPMLVGHPLEELLA